MVYPNALVMGYLKQTGQLTPEWRMKLEYALNMGYQRALTFRTQGGFDWYGRPPASTVLTAYGLLMLADVNRVYPIDRAVLDGARALLQSRRQTDGSWKLDGGEHTWSRIGGGALPLTAYVTWALIEAGAPGHEFRDAVQYLERNWQSAGDPYAVALCALALASADSTEAPAALEKLKSMAVRGTRGDAHWRAEGQGIVYARGAVADIEATAMAALALARGGRSVLLDPALTWLVRNKDPEGGWHSTQSTVLALKALLEAASKPRIDKAMRVSLRVNGRPVEGAFEAVTPETAETMQQAAIGALLREGENLVELEADGEAPMTFQVVSRHCIPWSRVVPPADPSVEIETAYDRTRLHVGEELACDVTVRFHGEASFMLIVDLGVPAGFAPRVDDLDRLVADKVIDRYTMTGRQITLYFGEVAKGQTFQLRVRMIPRFTIRTTVPAARAYEYYNPAAEGFARPVRLEVGP